MTVRNSTAALLVLVALVALAPIAGVVGAAGVGVGTQDSAGTGATTTNASTGAQLATVVQVTDDEVRHDIEVGSLEDDLDAENDTERAAAIANLSAELQEGAAGIAAEYEEATTAYENGELTAAEFGQRLAVLHARADAVQNGFDRVAVAAAQTSPEALDAAGYNASAVADARGELRSVSGSGTGALLAQFTGQADGEFSVETENGLEIEVESEDGEYSREYEGEEPEHGEFEVNRSEAQATAEAALSSPDDNGTWTLDEAETEDDGYYTFEFEYQGPSTSGEAEVGVDARENAVFSLEEEIERESEDDDDGDDEADESEGALSIEVVEGNPATDDTVTLRITDETGAPVAGADVEVDDGAGGTTAEDGTVTVLTGGDEFEVEAEHGDSEGELEMEFESEDGEHSREYDGQEPEHGVFDVDLGAAQATAEAALSTQDYNGTWTLTDASSDDDGYYTFGFAYVGTDATGEASVSVDARANEVFSLESELEASEGDGDDGRIAITFVDGEPAPNATVTLQITDASGDPVAGADVELDDGTGGTTDAEGTLTVTIPDGDGLDIEVEDGDREGALQIEFRN